MVALLAVAWVLVGVISVPLLIGWMNKRGNGMVRDPAMEAFVGAAFGPVPLLMAVFWVVLCGIGRVVFWITRQPRGGNA